MGNGSALEIVEEYAPGTGNATKYFTNTVTEVQLDEDAQLKHGYVIQAFAPTVPWPFAKTRARLQLDMIVSHTSCKAAMHLQ